MSTQNHQTHKRSPYRILPALGVVLALGMASSILSGFPRVAVAQAASAVSTDADQAYAAALHEYDHADPNQDNYLDLFHKQLKLAADKGSNEAQTLFAALQALGSTHQIETVRPLAQSGNVVALTTLGLAYRDGLPGAEKNEDTARQYFLLAAKQPIGASLAQLEIAKMYMTGSGVPKNLTVMMRWVKRAAGSGNPTAQRALAGYEAAAAKESAAEDARDSQARARCAQFAASAQFGCQLMMRRMAQ